MGRFFRAPDPQFVDNFIFEPDFKMLESGLAKKDAEILGKLANIELYRDVGIKAAPWDFSLAQQQKEEIAAKTKQIADDIYANKLTSTNDAKLNELSRSVEKNYLSGPISNIQESGLNYERYKGELAKLSPAAQEIYKRLPERHIAEMQQGGDYKVFKPGQMYESVNDIDAFFKSPSFQTLQPSDKEALMAWKRGKGDLRGYLTHTERPGISEERIMKTFKGFLESDPNTMERFKSYQNIAPDKFKYFDEQGQLGFDEGYTLSGLLPSIKAHAYEKPKQEIKHNEVLAENMRSANRLAGKADAYLPQGGVRIGDSSVMKNAMASTLSNIYANRVRPIIENVNASLPEGVKKIASDDFDGVLRTLKEKVAANAFNPLATEKDRENAIAMKKYVETLDKEREAALNASEATYDYLGKYGYSTKEIAAMKKNAANFEKGAINLVPVRLDFGTNRTINEVARTEKDGVYSADGINKIKGATVVQGTDTDNRIVKKIIDVTPVQGSTLPILYPDPEKNLNNGFLFFNVIVKYHDGSSEQIKAITSMRYIHTTGKETIPAGVKLPLIGDALKYDELEEGKVEKTLSGKYTKPIKSNLADDLSNALWDKIGRDGAGMPGAKQPVSDENDTGH